jgi:dihydrofolate synthase / folylpolyglutamate synthase
MLMNYSECVALLSALGHELLGMKFDLDAIRHALGTLGNPERAYPTAIVAGTNGKGSTCVMLAGILQCAGYRTGLYTSPHLVRVNERIRVADCDISDGDFSTAFTQVWDTVEGQVQHGRLDRRLSFFELLTATAFLHFARARVDFAVLEVGMGGRLDATNVTEPRVAVLTNVDLDHEEILGRTRALIAREKAGVVKPGRPVISACDDPEAREVIRERCREARADLLDLSEISPRVRHRQRDGRFVFDLNLNGDSFHGLVPALPGEFQVRNAAAAVAAAWKLRSEGYAISEPAISAGIRTARWPGRLQVVQHQPLIVLDGAHNPAAARELATFVRQQFPQKRVRLVYASMRDKSIEQISAALFPLAADVFLTRTDVSRAAPPEEILARACSSGGRAIIEPDPVEAVERACDASDDDDVVLVAGSLYLVGAVQQAILACGFRASCAARVY